MQFYLKYDCSLKLSCGATVFQNYSYILDASVACIANQTEIFACATSLHLSYVIFGTISSIVFITVVEKVHHYSEVVMFVECINYTN